MDYDLEIENIKKIIAEKKAKTVLIQLPEGLKPNATEIADKIKETGAQIFIWMGTCYGACDIPDVNFDLLIQFGHLQFVRG